MTAKIYKLNPFRDAHALHGDYEQDLRVVAEEHDRVIGKGTLRRLSVIRPGYAVDVWVDAALRRRGIGTAIFGELMRARPEKLPVTCRAMASHPERRAFAESLGFQILYECPSPQVDPTRADVRAWCASHADCEDISVVPMAHVDREQFLSAYTEMYLWTHSIWTHLTGLMNPVSHLAMRAQVTEMFSGHDEAISHVAVKDDRIVGMCVASLDVWEGRSFAWAETRDVDQPNGGAIIAAVVSATLTAFAQRGCRLVEFEGHDDYPHTDIVTALPAVGADPLTGLVYRN